MYTKVFRSIYDGTLADNWQALVTFQQMLILCDRDGIVDMTVAAIHRTTGIPIEILQKGVDLLEQPDPGSRTPTMEGRRIVRLDEHRPWGWKLVNYEYYRSLQSKEDKKEADRIRVAQKRQAEKSNKNNVVAECREQSQSVANVAHAEAEAEAKDKKLSSSAEAVDPQKGKGGKNLELTPPTNLGEKKAQRIRQITVDAITAFNAKLGKPKGCLASVSLRVGLGKREQQVTRVLRTAGEICEEQYGSKRITPEFWTAYFAEVDRDPFKSGRGEPGRGHERWKPTFEYLTREKTMLEVFDAAQSEDDAA
ncbi:MAG: hypothetical protein ACTHMO_03860 [Rhodanobacteraceae bacterium]